MKKLRLIKDTELAIYKEIAEVACDFCGKGRGELVFTSSYDECDNTHKCNMQICINCIKQLNKLITP